MAWSDDLLEDFRADSGDTDIPPTVSDAKIQEWYEAIYPNADSDEQAYALVMVKILRRLLGSVWKLVDKRGEVENESRDQYIKHLRDIMIPEWSELAGLNNNGQSNTLQIGTINLGIDYTSDDLEADLWDS